MRAGFLLIVLAISGCIWKADEPEPIVIGFVEAADVQASASSRQRLTARVLSTKRIPVSGIPVRWAPQPGAGFTDGIQTTTDIEGRAEIFWIAPQKIGTYGIGIFVDDTLARTIRATVFPAAAAKLLLSADTIRITNSGSPQKLGVRLFDQFDNPISPVWPNVARQITARVTSTQIFDTLRLANDVARDTGEVIFGLPVSGPMTTVLGRARVITQVAFPTLQVLAPPAFTGIAVGETVSLTLLGKDSAGRGYSLTAAALGLSFSSRNTAVATVDASGNVTGNAVGQAVIVTTRAEGIDSAVAHVVKAHDLGPQNVLYTKPPVELYRAPDPTRFAPSGRSLQVNNDLPHPSAGTPGQANVEWRRASGALATMRTMPYPVAVAPGPNDSWYLNRPVSRYDSVGTLLWTRSITGGSLAADSTMVVNGNGSSLRAWSSAGDSLWYRTTPVGIVSVAIAPTRVYYIGSSTLYAVDRAGVSLWSIAGPQIMGITDESSAYFGAWNGAVRALDPATGAERWSFAVTGTTGIALGPNNTLIVSSGNQLGAFDRVTGQRRWQVQAPTAVGNSLAVNGNRVVLASQHLFFYDAATGELVGRTIAKVGVNAPPLCTPGGLALSLTTAVVRHQSCQ